MNHSKLRAWLDEHTGSLLASGFFVSLVASARGIGFGRDESFYFHAARSYAGWFRQMLTTPAAAFSRVAIDAGWGYNHEHPPLAKALFAFSWMATNGGKHLGIDESLSFRLPAMLLASALIWLTHKMTRELYGARAALIAAALLACVPRFFFHSHLACFDIPIAAMWTASVYCYGAMLRAPTWRNVARTLVVVGLCFATKHNAWMLPAVFGPALLVQLACAPAKVGSKLGSATLLLAAFAPLFAIALWPWMWFDTVPRIREYVAFHMHHDYYNIEYLGRNINAPPAPFGYAFVLTAATVPTVTLLLWLSGLLSVLGGWLRNLRAYGLKLFDDDTRSRELIYLLAFVVPYAAFMVPTTPVFGGTKHWMTAYPFLALFAGRGADLCITALLNFRPVARQRAASATLAACLLAAPLVETMHAHPFGLSNYVPLAGGTEGGAHIGFHRQFWGFTTQGLAPMFEREARSGDTAFIHDTTSGAYEQMQREKRLPTFPRAVNSPNYARWGFVHHELHMMEIEANLWNVYETPAPFYVLTHDGVPIISVWRKR